MPHHCKKIVRIKKCGKESTLLKRNSCTQFRRIGGRDMHLLFTLKRGKEKEKERRRKKGGERKDEKERTRKTEEKAV
jgi:hypothetical protein